MSGLDPSDDKGKLRFINFWLTGLMCLNEVLWCSAWTDMVIGLSVSRNCRKLLHLLTSVFFCCRLSSTFIPNRDSFWRRMTHLPLKYRRLHRQLLSHRERFYCVSESFINFLFKAFKMMNVMKFGWHDMTKLYAPEHFTRSYSSPLSWHLIWRARHETPCWKWGRAR